MALNYIVKEFSALTPLELYSILQLRAEVFVVEQNCPYQDMDNKDQRSFHLMGWKEDRLCAYTRLIPPGIAYKEPSIGRVVTSPSIRRTGEGKTLMQHSIEYLQKHYPGEPIHIGAQLYLRKFYSSLGFEAFGDVYLEDGIEHIEMMLG